MTTSKFYANVLALDNIDEETRAFFQAEHDKAAAKEARDAERKQAKRDADNILIQAMIKALKDSAKPMATSDIARAIECSSSKITALYKGYLSDDPHIVREEVKGAKNTLVKAYSYRA